jgi:ketosteroid isomerase-like protein
MSDPLPVLFANEAFYVAFAARDAEAMDAVWSRRDTVTCTHPSATPLVGRDRVMRSGQAILTNPASPAIACRNPIPHVFGDVAYVLCWEQIQQSFLAATNVFVREDGRWRMVHHHAAATPPPENLEATSAGPMQ